MKDFVTNITTEENKEIEVLIEKLNSLNSLMTTLDENSDYANFRKNNIDRINNDYMQVDMEMKKWWGKILSKYNLKKIDKFTYSVMCNENAIYRIEQSKVSCIECN